MNSKQKREPVEGIARCGVVVACVLALALAMTCSILARSQSTPSKSATAGATASAIGAVPSWAQATPDKAAERQQRAAAHSSAKTLADLPPAVLPAISSALGRDDARYRVRKTADGYSAQNAANHLVSHYAAKGVEVRSQNANLGFEFQGWGYAEHPANKNKSAVAPRVNANRVEYRRGALTEWYVNGPLGIEQGFTISQPPLTLPDSQHDALDIVLRLRGNLSASIESGRHALTLWDQRGVEILRYGPLQVYDASGRELESWMEVQDGSVRLRVNTTGARYPVIVDPWVQAVQLTNPSGVAGEQLGRSVAVSGTTIVVGDTQLNAAQGAVFVFVEPASGWAATTTFAAKLTASDGAAGDFFGLSVGINESGNTVVVGAPQTGTSSGAGAAYVFVEPITAGGWADAPSANETAKLVADDVSSFGEFGWSVGIDASGDTVVVGAPFTPFIGYGSTNPNNQKGEAYVFVEPTVAGVPTWTPGPLIETAKLIASDGKAGDALGSSVGINESGDTVVAGAIDATINAQYQGAAYVFVDPGPTPADWVTPTTTPNFNAKLFASDATADSYLGWSVGISGNTVVAGAVQATIGSNSAQGAAYVFVDPGPTPADWATPTTTPTYNAQLTAADGAAKDEFGTSVGISGSTVVVSAASDVGGVGTGAAAAYVFAKPTTGGWTNTSTSAELTGGTAGNFFGYSVSISGNTIVASAPDAKVGSNANQGAVYVFSQEVLAAYSPALLDFGTVVENVPTTQTVTVTDDGTGPLVIQQVLPSGTGFSISQYTCNQGGSVSSPAYPITLNLGNPGDSCTYTVQFDPTAPGLSSGALQFEDNAGMGQSNLTSTANGSYFLQSVPLSGTGGQGIATTTTINSTSSSFEGKTLNGNVALVSTSTIKAPVTVQFTVAGSPTPTGGSVQVTDDLTPPDTCTGTLTAGAGQCDLYITSYPTSGTTTNLTATYNSPASGYLASPPSAKFPEEVVEVIPCGADVSPMTVRKGASNVDSFTVCLAGNINVLPSAAYFGDCVPYGQCSLTVTLLAGTTNVYVVSVKITTSFPGCVSPTGCESSSGTSSGVLLPPPSGRWPRSGPWWPLALFALATLLAMRMAFVLVRRRGRPLRLVYTAGLILALVLTGISGCGSSAHVTPVGTYTVNVKVQAGTFSVVVPVTVQVTP